MKRIKLEFDKRIHPNGSKEHFWHFMLGYLLPSVHFFFKNKNEKIQKDINGILLVYEDCGPLMNPMIREITTLLDIPFDIIDQASGKQMKSFDEKVYLPRWDLRLFTSIYFLIYKNRYNSNLSIRKKDIQWFIKKNTAFPRKAFGIKLKKDLLFTRNLILNKLDIVKPKERSYLFLDRSDFHSYYAPDGKAENKGYGKSRRALINLEEGCSDLNEKGTSAEIFQPGSYSLVHQIKTFNNAKGVIGIRGAEFANMIWLEPRSRIAVIGFMKPAFHLYNYACMLNLHLSERSSDSDNPDIKEYNIKNLLER